jgi:NAD(P)-dependent dehydrogenase (short-subunit alcohol dehydrogenase family)
LVSSWLTEHQLPNPAGIVLLGRSGRMADPVFELLLSDTPVTLQRCDVTETEDIAAVLAAGSRSHLAAVLHAGGLLQDAVVLKQSSSSLRAVFAPKLAFLQQVTAAVALQPLQHVNLFSSVSAFLGSPGQSNYAAANMGLNAWAQQLQAQGQPGKLVLLYTVQKCPGLKNAL